MPENIRLKIFENGQKVLTEECSEPIELGRQRFEAEERFRVERLENRVRISIARIHEVNVARQQLLVEPLAREGWVRLTNQSAKVCVRLGQEGGELAPRGSQEAPLPVSLRVGQYDVFLETLHLNSLAEVVAPPGSRENDSMLLATLAPGMNRESDSLVSMFQAILEVQRAATISDCFNRAAEALVNLVRLDAGRVLLLEKEESEKKEEWRVKAVKGKNKESQSDAACPWRPSSQILTSLQANKRTFWKVPSYLDRMNSLAGVEILVAAPILDRDGQVIGALYGEREAGSNTGATNITEPQANLVQVLACGIADMLAQTRLAAIERELEFGQQMQQHFLPGELPQVDGWELAVHFQPAGAVSGDFYDAFTIAGNYLGIVIADVCGKGVGAGLYMTLYRSLLRSFAEQAASSTACAPCETAPAEWICQMAVERTNDYVVRTHVGFMFCTLFFGVLDTSRKALTYINAGHDAPAVVNDGRVKQRCVRTGPVLGVESQPDFEVKTIPFELGDILVAYTDGITESRSAAGEFFGEQRMLKLMESPCASPAALLSEIANSVRRYIGHAVPHDDVTMLAVRRVM